DLRDECVPASESFEKRDEPPPPERTVRRDPEEAAHHGEPLLVRLRFLVRPVELAVDVGFVPQDDAPDDLELRFRRHAPKSFLAEIRGRVGLAGLFQSRGRLERLLVRRRLQEQLEELAAIAPAGKLAEPRLRDVPARALHARRAATPLPEPAPDGE